MFADGRPLANVADLREARALADILVRLRALAAQAQRPTASPASPEARAKPVVRSRRASRLAALRALPEGWQRPAAMPTGALVVVRTGRGRDLLARRPAHAPVVVSRGRRAVAVVPIERATERTTVFAVAWRPLPQETSMTHSTDLERARAALCDEAACGRAAFLAALLEAEPSALDVAVLVIRALRLVAQDDAARARHGLHRALDRRARDDAARVDMTPSRY